MNACSFITFVTCMLRQNGIPFYKGLYVTFELSTDPKKIQYTYRVIALLNEGHFSILINSMLQTY